MEGRRSDHAGDTVRVVFARTDAGLGGGFIEDGRVGNICVDQKHSTALHDTCSATTTTITKAALIGSPSGKRQCLLL